ncbi:cytochrome b5-like [Vespa mandarinia]|uniref:cytochrome b5-like n=1 Tax=Vespa mandarinia TaxID=7446 RepID=UPI00161D92F6|nr:cytochrome b5-like [Vespa mandarinia]
MANVYTRIEVERHNKKEDLWLVIHGGVYDLTDFVKKHPGGEEVLINLAGQDGTVCFDDIGHSGEAILLKETFKIGQIVNNDNATTTISTSDPIQAMTKPTIVDDGNWEYQEVKKEENNKTISIVVAAGILIYGILFYYYVFY